MIVKLVKMMNDNLAGLIEHIKKIKTDEADNDKFTSRKIYQGRTEIWEDV